MVVCSVHIKADCRLGAGTAAMRVSGMSVGADDGSVGWKARNRGEGLVHFDMSCRRLGGCWGWYFYVVSSRAGRHVAWRVFVDGALSTRDGAGGCGGCGVLKMGL